MRELAPITDEKHTRQRISSRLGTIIDDAMQHAAPAGRWRYYHEFGPEAALALQRVLGGTVRIAEVYLIGPGYQAAFLHDLPLGPFDPFEAVPPWELEEHFELAVTRPVSEVVTDVDNQLVELISGSLLKHIGFTH